MKKLLLITIALVFVTIMKANPIITPGVALSELKFDSNGNWVIELQYFSLSEGMPIDNIWITSKSGTSKLKSFNVIGKAGVLLVRNDSLSSNLSIDPLADSIKISYRVVGHMTIVSDPLVYGYPDALLMSSKTSQSIAAIGVSYRGGTYSIDKSPTLGAINDTIGMCGTINGNIYDINNQLLSTTISQFRVEPTYTDLYMKSDKSYSGRMYSYKNHITELSYWIGNTNSGRRYYAKISPIDVLIQPDTVVTVDIHLLESLVTGIDEINSEKEFVFHVSPNPIKDLAFNYDVSIPVKSSNSYIELIGLNGKRIAKLPITEDRGRINLPENTENGLYTLRLFLNNKNYATSKIVIAK